MVNVHRIVEISIHAPREGCDYITFLELSRREISIHAPREGCDNYAAWYTQNHMPFQSTHPVRGATFTGYDSAESFQFQSTHPVRGATWWSCINFRCYNIISIHAPREGCDSCPASSETGQGHFNPRTP